MKSLMCSLSVVLLIEIGKTCDVATHMDERKLIHRVKHEGNGFLTIALPAFCSHLERCVAEGLWSPIQGFHCSESELPLFLGGFIDRLFDTRGYLRTDICVTTFHHLRQFCLLWKKVELPCPEKDKVAFSAYVSSNLDVDRCHEFIPEGLYDLFGQVSDVIWGSVLHSTETTCTWREYLPKHGPGATSERLRGNSKWSSKDWHLRLQGSFPALEFLGGYSYYDKCEDSKEFQSSINIIPVERERPIRVITVPKTQKGPRVIGIEPVCNQYCQQALLAELTKSLENHRFTKGLINFTSQDHNRKRALESSSDGKWASLDLKEASDRVSASLVYRMLESVPSLRDALFACRSTIADVPGHGLVHLNRFASMGSAVCFPIEAMIFFTLIVTSRISKFHTDGFEDNTFRDAVYKLSRDVLVYGDDLFVPTEEATDIIETLEVFGLLVNRSKSFWTGKFRESCGMDAYDGHEVTVTKCRHSFPSDIRDYPRIVSWVAFGNNLWKQGFWSTASEVRRLVEKLTGPLPYTHEKSPILGWHSHREYQTVVRWNKTWQRFETRGPVYNQRKTADPLQGRSALVKCLLTSVGKPSVDSTHLDSYDLRGAGIIKTRWSSLY